MEILGQNEGKETVRERNPQMPALADSCAGQPAVNGNPGSKHLTLALKKMIGWRNSLIRWGVTPEAIRMSIQRCPSSVHSVNAICTTNCGFRPRHSFISSGVTA